MTTCMDRAGRSHAPRVFIQIDDATRARLERAIEALLGFLDDLDAPFADLEADIDEPSLGAGNGDVCGSLWASRDGYDRDLELDAADDEPSLGVPEATPDRLDQRCWARGGSDDREVDVGCEEKRPRRPRLLPPPAPLAPMIEIRPGVSIRFAEPGEAAP